MHRCCSSHGNMVGPCSSCGPYYSQSNSFSMFFSMPNHKPFDDQSDMYSSNNYSSPYYSSSSVDCTLSLGTPSTRLSNAENEKRNTHHERRSTSSCMSNFCWDLLGSSKHAASPPSSAQKSSRGSNSISSGGGGGCGGDPLLARRCANCDTTSTPLWRNGPRGPKSLCNACGIRFKKEERRATAAAATSNSGAAAAGMVDAQHMLNSSWVNHHSQASSQKMPCFSSAYGNEFRFIEDDDRDSENGIPFLSWRLNVTDRPSLIHDFTR